MKQFHVVYRKKTRDWALREALRACSKCGHTKRAIVTYPDKQQTVEHGIRTAMRAKGQLIIHKRNGRIQTEYTYGKDPFPPRG